MYIFSFICVIQITQTHISLIVLGSESKILCDAFTNQSTKVGEVGDSAAGIFSSFFFVSLIHASFSAKSATKASEMSDYVDSATSQFVSNSIFIFFMNHCFSFSFFKQADMIKSRFCAPIKSYVKGPLREARVLFYYYSHYRF